MRAELGLGGRALDGALSLLAACRRAASASLQDSAPRRRLPSSSLPSGPSRRPPGRNAASPVLCAAAPATSGAFSTSASGKDSGPRVCILGGGFGGLYTAIALDRLNWPEGRRPQVTLVDCSDRFVFKPLLYEVMQGLVQPWEAAPHFADLLAPFETTFVQGRVVSVAPDQVTKDGGSAGGGEVALEGGRSLKYDWLVLALGSEPDTRDVPGVKEHAVPFSTLEDANRVLEGLREVEARGKVPRVVVVGGGYAGVELAAAVGDRLKGHQGAVTLVTNQDTILDSAGEAQRAASSKVLASQGVEVRTGLLVFEVAARARGDTPLEVSLIPDPVCGGGAIAGSVQADLVLWTAGARPATGKGRDDAGRFPFPRSRAGALQTDATLRVINHARVFALGDVAVAGSEAGGRGFPPTAQVAFQQADYTAWNLWAGVNGRPLLPFRYQHLGNMMSLGGDSASIALPFGLPEGVARAARDSGAAALAEAAGVKIGEGGGDVSLEGPLAAFVRRAAYWYRQPTTEHRARVGASWCQQVASEVGRWGQGGRADKPR
eukprot:evm.model.scf_65.16 EVM.evm.TU.scf_65.16   scf_65:121184-122824(-)